MQGNGSLIGWKENGEPIYSDFGDTGGITMPDAPSLYSDYTGASNSSLFGGTSGLVNNLQDNLFKEQLMKNEKFKLNKQFALDKQALFKNEANARIGQRAFLQSLDFGNGPGKVSSYNKPLFADPRKSMNNSAGY